MSPAFLLLAAVVVAINLRPAITAVGPVLPQIKASTGLGDTALGALGAVPIVAFAIVSPLVTGLTRRFGLEHTIVGSLALLVVGTVLRSWPGPDGNLWLGTAIVGATIAVGNVAMPTIVKRDFPLSAPRVTSIYVAALSVFAALASGVAVPLAAASSLGWRLSLGAWALVSLLALLVWVPRAARAPRPRAVVDTPEQLSTTVWNKALAWQLAAYMGLQSAGYYVVLTWLPTVEQELEVPAETAGWHLFFLQIMGIAGNLGAPLLMRLGRDQRIGAVVPGLLLATGTLGLLWAPGLVWLWVSLIGLATGSAFVISLSLMAMRAHSPHVTGQLSAMSQALGYALAGGGLVLAGWLRSFEGRAVLVEAAAIGGAVIVMALFVGRDRMISAGSAA